MNQEKFKNIINGIGELKINAYQYGNTVKETGEQEFFIDSENVYISFFVDASAKMKFVSGEEEQGLNTGHYLPIDHETEVHHLEGIVIWLDDSNEAILDSEQQTELYNKILCNLKFNTVLS